MAETCTGETTVDVSTNWPEEALSDPVLAELWDNDEDAVYDE